MPITYGNYENVEAMDVAFSIHADIESTIYDMEYPEYEWPQILLPEQIKRNINPGATSVAYKTRNHKGVAAFIGNGPNNDIPMVGVAMGAVDVPLAVSAVGFRMTNEDARQFTFGMNGDLAHDLGAAAGTAAENLIERSIIFGNEDLKFHPWINYPGVAIINSLKRWGAMTAEEKNATLNRIVNTMFEETRTLFMVTDLFLPQSIYADMVNNPMVVGGVGVAQSVMAYFKANNLSAERGRGLNIHPSRYLSEAGADGQNRIVAMCRGEKHQVWPFPMDYRVGQPVPEPLGAAWYGEQKFGGYHVRQIGTMLYMDGI